MTVTVDLWAWTKQEK